MPIKYLHVWTCKIHVVVIAGSLCKNITLRTKTQRCWIDLDIQKCSSRNAAGYDDLDVNIVWQDFSLWKNMEAQSTVHAKSVEEAHPEVVLLPTKNLQEDTGISPSYCCHWKLTYVMWMFAVTSIE